MMLAFRRAALHLYLLENSDKNWLLNKLSKVSREKIKYLLHELEEMDVPKNHDWLYFLEATDGVDPSSTENESITYIIKKLDNLSPKIAFEFLKNERDCIVAAILTYKNWHWKDNYFTLLDKQRRKKLNKEIEQASCNLPSIIQISLIVAFDKKIRENKRFTVDHSIVKF